MSIVKLVLEGRFWGQLGCGRRFALRTRLLLRGRHIILASAWIEIRVAGLHQVVLLWGRNLACALGLRVGALERERELLAVDSGLLRGVARESAEDVGECQRLAPALCRVFLACSLLNVARAQVVLVHG